MGWLRRWWWSLWSTDVITLDGVDQASREYWTKVDYRHGEIRYD
jgi:hypothetical protein